MAWLYGIYDKNFLGFKYFTGNLCDCESVVAHICRTVLIYETPPFFILCNISNESEYEVFIKKKLNLLRFTGHFAKSGHYRIFSFLVVKHWNKASHFLFPKPRVPRRLDTLTFSHAEDTQEGQKLSGDGRLAAVEGKNAGPVEAENQRRFKAGCSGSPPSN